MNELLSASAVLLNQHCDYFFPLSPLWSFLKEETVGVIFIALVWVLGGGNIIWQVV